MKYQARTYKQKALSVQAIEWNGDDHCHEFIEEWTNGVFARAERRNVLEASLYPGAVTHVFIGDYIIKQDETYKVISAETFDKLYELTTPELASQSDLWPEESSKGV